MRDQEERQERGRERTKKIYQETDRLEEEKTILTNTIQHIGDTMIEDRAPKDTYLTR